MIKRIACLALTLSFATPGFAQEKSFVYTEKMASSLSLASFCSAERMDSAEEGEETNVMKAMKREANGLARELGFERGGTCYPLQKETISEMYTLLFMMGSHVLYLTSDEIEQFSAYIEANGRESDEILISESWTPNS